MERRRPTTLYALGAVLVVALGYFLFAILPQRMALSASQRQLTRAEAKAKQAGIALTDDDLKVKEPRVENNAAFIYMNAAKYEQTYSVNSAIRLAESPTPVDLSVPSDLAALSYATDNMQPLFDAVAVGAAKPACQFPNIMKLGDASVAQANHHLMFWVDLFDAKAGVLAAQGHPLQAEKYLKVAAQISHQLTTAPGQGSILNGAACALNVEQVLAGVLGKSGKEPGVADGATEILNLLTPPDVPAALNARLVKILDIVRDGTTENILAALGMGFEGRAVEPVLRNQWQAKAIDAYTQAITIWKNASLAPIARLEACRKVGQTVQEGAGVPYLFVQYYPPEPELMVLLSPAEAGRRALLQAVAIFKRGSAPATLPLGGKMAQNPMTGDPLTYKPTGNGFSITAPPVPKSALSPLAPQLSAPFSVSYPSNAITVPPVVLL